MVVAGGDVGDQRTEHVERSSLAPLLLQSNVLLNHVQWHVPGPLDHDLHVVLPGTLGQLGQRAQLGQLRLSLIHISEPRD